MSAIRLQVEMFFLAVFSGKNIFAFNPLDIIYRQDPMVQPLAALIIVTGFLVTVWLVLAQVSSSPPSPPLPRQTKIFFLVLYVPFIFLFFWGAMFDAPNGAYALSYYVPFCLFLTALWIPIIEPLLTHIKRDPLNIREMLK